MFVPRLTRVLIAACVLLGIAAPVSAQDTFDASWYDASAPYIKIGVAQDGVYRVSRTALEAAGLPETVDPATIQLFENGLEVPIEYRSAGDALIFVGRRNRGTDEHWAYNYNADWQSSTFHSLYSDTTFYWMTWGKTAGQRYEEHQTPSSGPATRTVRDTLHIEQDNTYFYGQESWDPLYTPGEGYYWESFRLNTSGTTAQNTYTVPLDRLDRTASDSLSLAVHLRGSSGSCHRATLAARLQTESGSAFTPVDDVSWNRYTAATLQATIAPGEVPATHVLDLRLTVHAEASCGTPNFVLLDWIETRYPRRLEADGSTDAQSFSAPAGAHTFELSGHTSPVNVYAPATQRRYEAPGTAPHTVATNAPVPATYWAAGSNGFRAPASVEPDAPSDWANPANEADYVILTTPSLRPSAEELAAYRRAQDNYKVAIVEIQNVFDQFDYGRPTPVAIRRFVRATQNWIVPPQFLTIWADAPFPVYTETGFGQRRPAWAIPSFGYGPSDGWFAMQNAGRSDWSESIAIGRVPLRTNAQGTLFVEKLDTYENAPPADWKKRMLMLAGGTTAGEQNTLQFYSNQWAMTATGVPGDTLYTAGMDTLFYYKKSDDALDTSFQDSLSVDLQRGAGWLNYFGHSGAQTWEIVTDPPRDFDNAGRLPFVVSLGCKTGSFAGGRFEDKDEPSLGEALILNSPNGGIAHWGTSELGNLLPSARLNTELINRVFQDTSRVVGRAIQDAKAAINEQFGQSSLYARHLLQYGLLGDPALRLNLPTAPDFHVAPEQLTTSPLSPTPGETLTLSARVKNRGLVPADSVTLEITHELPNGTQAIQTRRLPRFALEEQVNVPYLLDETTLGTNTFRVRADPENTYAEPNETDNAAAREQVVSSTGLAIVAPTDQGIATSRQPTLRWTLVRRSEEPVSIAVELDSVATFDSGALQRDRLSAADLTADWMPSSALDAGQTYLWRARIEDGTGSSTWSTGSFTVRPGLKTSGWLQQKALFESFAERSQLQYENGTWTFDTFDLEVFASSERGAGTFKGQFNIGGSRTFERLNLGFGVLVIDDTTGRVVDHASFCTYEVPDNLVTRGCTGEIDGAEAVAALESLLASVERGNYVFTRTRHLGRQSGATLPDAVKTAFCGLGTPGIQCGDAPSAVYSDSIAALTYNDLWLMQARKGFPDETVERVARSTEDTNEITRRVRLPFFRDRGQTTTARIGPAAHWDAFDWSATFPTETSTLRFEVRSGDDETVLKTIDARTPAAEALSDIAAEEHPFLRLHATFADSVQRAPPQLKRWQLTYTPTAELAARGTALQSLPDTLQEGEPFTVTVPIRNVGDEPSTSVHVTYILTDADNRTQTVATDTLAAINARSEATSTASLSTTDFPGANVLTVTASQRNAPERITFNNTLVHNFFVEADRSAPMLDVLVDGRKLRPNPEPVTNLQDPSLPFVSTQPTIEILLADDNPYFPLSDTSLTEVYLDDRLVSFASPDLTFEAATEAGNEARILFTPDFSGQDTTHTLRVEAQDASGNELSEPYQTHFRISTEQVIRDLYPYPNPMNTHTTFAFRVEGGTQHPSDFQLRIYTLSGRLIRTFDGFDVNGGVGLRIGWNKLRWNGRDADGDRVATGVYLYRVSMDGEDGAFEGDVEKIAVIR